MNLILVSGRFAVPGEHHAADEEFARALVAAGCAVRWIAPVPPSPGQESRTDRAIDGVRGIEVSSAAPGFRAIQGRLADWPTESVLASEIRGDLPDAVHVLSFGGATSINLAWLADRMGVPTIVGLQSTPVLCHRGDLVHASGEECAQWDDAERCVACCLVPGVRGVGRVSSVLGRMFGAVRWPLHPLPKPLDFVNRRELVLGGLQWARRIVVDSEAEQERILAFGARADQVAVMAGRGIEDWLGLFRSVVAGS